MLTNYNMRPYKVLGPTCLFTYSRLQEGVQGGGWGRRRGGGGSLGAFKVVAGFGGQGRGSGFIKYITTHWGELGQTLRGKLNLPKTPTLWGLRV